MNAELNTVNELTQFSTETHLVIESDIGLFVIPKDRVEAIIDDKAPLIREDRNGKDERMLRAIISEWYKLKY